jgi:hypothetical protein
MNNREGWNVTHTANNEVDLTAEKIVQSFVDEHFFEMIHAVDEKDFKRKDALKIVNALKSARVMLVWNDNETNL